MTMVTTPDSNWETTAPVPLTGESLRKLLAGKLPLIKIPHFISEDLSASIVEQLETRFSPYLHATGPAVDKVGVAQFEFQAQSQEDMRSRQGNEKQRYFDEVKKMASIHDDLSAAVGTNVWRKIIDTLAALVPEWDVGVAVEPSCGNRQYYSGVFRKINNGTPPHCDWCPYDVPAEENWVISRITCQAVFNLYLTPVTGGSTTIHDVQWTEDALRYRDPESYGYARALVDDRAHCRFDVEVGQLCIFNSRNMHEVAPIENSNAPRIALASFMGLLPSEVTGGKPRLIFWS